MMIKPVLEFFHYRVSDAKIRTTDNFVEFSGNGLNGSLETSMIKIKPVVTGMFVFEDKDKKIVITFGFFGRSSF